MPGRTRSVNAPTRAIDKSAAARLPSGCTLRELNPRTANAKFPTPATMNTAVKQTNIQAKAVQQQQQQQQQQQLTETAGPTKRRRIADTENALSNDSDGNSMSVAAPSVVRAGEPTPAAASPAGDDTTPSASHRTEGGDLESEPELEPESDGDDFLHGNLLTLASSLYLDARKRLCLEYPARCCLDFEFCCTHHYRQPQPSEPNTDQANNLECELQQERYSSFITTATRMCVRREFPGTSIFTMLIETFLSLNAKSFNNESYGEAYSRCLELFGLLVRTFPPCWLAMRPVYLTFLLRPLNARKISRPDGELRVGAVRLFPMLVELLVHTLEQCTPAELATKDYVDPTVVPSFREGTAGTHALNSSYYDIDTDIDTVMDWEDSESRLQTFEALPQRSRLARLMIVLRTLLPVLENDLVMWMLHHYRKPKDCLLAAETAPFTVVIFEFTKYKRLTPLVESVFRVFAIAIRKGLYTDALRVLERYLTLILATSNAIDIEKKPTGIAYPVMGNKTRHLIRNLFDIYKVENIKGPVRGYLKVVELLRLPYARMEFIDRFVEMFYSPKDCPMSPRKIVWELTKKRWREFRPAVQLTAANDDNDDDDDDLSREQYMDLLLEALKCYCEFYGTKQFLHFLLHNSPIKCAQTKGNTPHRYPTAHRGEKLLLRQLEADIGKLEQQLRMQVRLTKPPIDLPLAPMCVDDAAVGRFRSDAKFLLILHDLIMKLSAECKSVDFAAWKAYLSDLQPDREEADEEEQRPTSNTT